MILHFEILFIQVYKHTCIIEKICGLPMRCCIPDDHIFPFIFFTPSYRTKTGKTHFLGIDICKLIFCLFHCLKHLSFHLIVLNIFLFFNYNIINRIIGKFEDIFYHIIKMFIEFRSNLIWITKFNTYTTFV